MNAALAIDAGLEEATSPPERRGVARDAVRMLVTDRAAGTHEHARFFDLPKYLRRGDLLVVNDSATLPAALRAARRGGERIALHVSTRIDDQLWVVEPRAAVSPGEIFVLDDGAAVTLLTPLSDTSTRLWYAAFTLPVPMHAFLAKHGKPIRYAYMTANFPLSDYQTVFARNPGSVEMPSAARPFTERTVREVRSAGAAISPITLHCGVASLEAPERPSIERFAVPHPTAEAVNAARAQGRRVIAVGTTVVRALESAVRRGKVTAASGWTDLVIEPGHRLQAADALITGFHEPAATHIAMLRAFASEELLSQAYAAAAERRYFKHEFGDVHAIL
ncbi:MAG TPA: S-adenosylmethionine:tRNA ribosyltransferase-isomerase [Candidatus Baltobacteraceae bacterium]|nr:S-adenosylmethionine:tRNA ribosyltransferase-isomerase [Candidatus Baltobacteraceae bacterium]